MAMLGRWFGRLASAFGEKAGWAIALGTEGYDPKTRRRLRSLNVGCFTIAVSCGLFALTYALEDPSLYAYAVAVNLAMMMGASIVPAFHRINDLAGTIFIAAILLIGLFLLVALMGRLSGIQVNFVAASAAAFLIFELRRIGYIVVLIAAAIALHVAGWVLFPEGLIRDVRPGFQIQIYITIVVTISIIVAVLVYYAFWTAERAEAETDALLLRILPLSVAERLKARPAEPISDSLDSVAILFSDLVGFVALSRSLGAARTVTMLNHLIQGFDRIAADEGVEKIKTIGDAYMAAAGIPNPTPDAAARLARMALRMREAADETAELFGVELNLRIGIALGPVMAGVIGRNRFAYDLWGDSVNLAARLEQSAEIGRIQVSSAFRDTLADQFEFVHRGSVKIKGVGEEHTWYLVGGSGAVEERAHAASHSARHG
jgi:adenylate cyclase